jgi:hypothetical protein
MPRYLFQGSYSLLSAEEMDAAARTSGGYRPPGS